MKYHLSKLIVLMIIGIISSCYNPSVQMENDPDFISIKALVETQFEKLEGKQMKKVVNWENEGSEKIFRIDSLFLADELSNFYELEISTDALIGGYEKTQTANKITFTRKESEKRGPRFVSFEKTDGQLSIAGELLDKTVLYTKGTTLKLTLNLDGQLLYYAINGSQKMAVGEEVTYSIKGAVLD